MKKTAIKYGLICGLVYIVFALGNILMTGDGSQSNPMIGLLVALVMTVSTFFVIFYGIKEYRDTFNQGVLKVGEAVKLGLMIAVIASLLAAIFNIVYYNFIDPGYLERMIETTRESLEERGQTEEQIEMAMWWTNLFSNPILAAAVSIVWTSLWGLLKGLISGSILKKEPTPTL